MKKFKLTLKSGKERYKISDDTLEELTQKLVNKNVSFEKLEIDHRHKICEVPDCNNNATHGQHEIGQVVKSLRNIGSVRGVMKAKKHLKESNKNSIRRCSL